MQTLQDIWQDLRQGENIDLYVTICVAVALALLNALQVVDQTLVDSVNLAVLAILAASMLGNRHRLEAIEQGISSTAKQFFRRNLPESFKTDLEKRSELWVIGTALPGRIHQIYSLMADKLRKGGRINVLVVSPDGEGCRIAADRVHGHFDVEQFRSIVRATLTRLCELKEIAPDRLTIKTLDPPLSIGGFAGDLDDVTNGVLFLKYYSFKVPGGLPRFVLRPKDGEWYDYFREEIVNMWENGDIWDCKSL